MILCKTRYMKKIENWKKDSKKYLLALENLLDKIENIEDEELKIEIRNQILKCDNELTILAEKLFKEYYLEGKNDAKKE